MGWWSRIEQALWTGEIRKDYGVISERWMGAAKRRDSALLTRRRGADRFVIRTSYKAFLGASVAFVDFDRDGATKLRDALDDALVQMQ